MNTAQTQLAGDWCLAPVSPGALEQRCRRTRFDSRPAPVRRLRRSNLHPVSFNGCYLPRYPIVLVHGFLGFDSFGVSHLTRRYFRGVREFLESIGCDVHVLSLPATAAVAVRAEELVRQVNEITAGRVNIVAHSMGGLDARYAVSKLGLARKTASVITLGTPHRGTPIADLVAPGAKLVTGEGLHDLTTARATDFNMDVQDSRSVFYASIIGASTTVQGCLAAGYEYLRRVVGPNDGVVPTESQRWGKILDEVDADHLAQIGWSRHFDMRPLYASLVGQLALNGY